MADEAPELLHLLKAGRILQYRQQNVALVSAKEGAEFDISYAKRWVAPDLEIEVGDGAIVILSDSPYAKVDPARFPLSWKGVLLTPEQKEAFYASFKRKSRVPAESEE